MQPLEPSNTQPTMSTNTSNQQPHPPFPLQKKGLLGAAGRGGKFGAGGAGMKGNMVSPTDNMMSPVTAKLQSSKQRHFLKGKPTSLFNSTTANSPGMNSAPGTPMGHGETGSVAAGGSGKEGDVVIGKKEEVNPFAQ